MTSANAAPLSQDNTDLKQCANAIRALAMDAVQAANSGHPGMPMGMADVATVLYSKFLKFDPKNPTWPNRDRFVLSGGHGSMLLYAVNYLTGYEKISLEDIKNFRQLGSITAGHPEVEQDAGIEMTTGPLGQGISTAVGMAIAERKLNARYGDLINHYTYVMCGDGDLMEGITHESCALAGHLKLNKMIVLYDDNSICIDGSTDLTFTENTPKRFESYGWNVIDSVNGHDFAEIEAAISKAQDSDKPTLICCKTKIGYGAPTKEGTSSCHGAPLGEEELAGAKKNIGWNYGSFEIPEDILSTWHEFGSRHTETYAAWQRALNDHGMKECFTKFQAKDFSAAIAPVIAELKKDFATDKPKKATRQLSGMCLEKLVDKLWLMIGGSADLTGSNNTKVKASEVLDAENYGGNYINYGVREHGMAALMNGMSLHSPLVPYAGTFLQFADYSRPAIRLAALMGQRVIHVMTHDSIGLGEDGPTHQPVEHLAALRAIPNCYLYRPCDGIETAESWELAINDLDSPSVMALTRQGLPTLTEDRAENMVAKGAYILKETGGTPEITLFASGSEVAIAHDAYEQLVADGHAVRLVSVPCMDRFLEQESSYIENLTCNNSVKVAVEAAIRQGWDGIIGPHGAFIGMKSFGASGPIDDLYNHFGITAKAVIEAAKKKLNK